MESKGARVYWATTRQWLSKGTSIMIICQSAVFRRSKMLRYSPKPLPLKNSLIHQHPNWKISAGQWYQHTQQVSPKTIQKSIRPVGRKGRVVWRQKKLVLAPGVQKPSNDWMAVAEGCVDEYTFEAEIAAAEALEPRNLAEAKGCPDWCCCFVYLCLFIIFRSESWCCCFDSLLFESYHCHTIDSLHCRSTDS